jgi:hypothetical protein
MKSPGKKSAPALHTLPSPIIYMDVYLDKLKWLYLHMPILGQCKLHDLRKIFDQYIPILADVTSTDDEFRFACRELNDKADDIDMLISADLNAKTIKEKELFFSGAHSFLKADIKSLICLIEIIGKKTKN